MASRYRSFSRPALSFLNYAAKKPTSHLPASTLPRPPPLFSRVARGSRAVQTLLPLHSAVSTARLTSRLGADSAGGSRALSQGTLCRSNPGV